MDPAVNWRPTEDPAQQQEAERYVITAKKGKIERCYHLLIKALGINRCAPRGNALLVAAIALRATDDQQYLLPSGAPDPYAVLALDPAISTARNPAIIESYYRQASKLLDHCHPPDPCWPAFTNAARLVADAWAFPSDPRRKASLDSRFEALDSRFEAAATPAALVPTAQLQPAPQLMLPQPAPPPPPAQAGPDDMGRGQRPKKAVRRTNL